MNDFRNRDFFHEGMREFQDLFDGRRTAEAIETNRKHYEFWEDEKGNKNIKNYYYMMNPNVIPYIDVECGDMRQNKFDNFLNLIKETI